MTIKKYCRYVEWNSRANSWCRDIKHCDFNDTKCSKWNQVEYSLTYARTTQHCFKMSWMMNGLMTEQIHGTALVIEWVKRVCEQTAFDTPWTMPNIHSKIDGNHLIGARSVLIRRIFVHTKFLLFPYIEFNEVAQQITISWKQRGEMTHQWSIAGWTWIMRIFPFSVKS